MTSQIVIALAAAVVLIFTLAYRNIKPRLNDTEREPTSDPIAVMAAHGITQLENYLRQEADQ